MQISKEKIIIELANIIRHLDYLDIDESKKNDIVTKLIDSQNILLEDAEK